MEHIETNDGAASEMGAKSSPLKKVSEMIMEAAPDDGPIADAAVRIASTIETTDENIRNFDFATVGPALRGLPWGVIGGVALAAGGMVIALNKKARKAVVSGVDDLLDTSFSTTTNTKKANSRGKVGVRSQKAKAH